MRQAFTRLEKALLALVTAGGLTLTLGSGIIIEKLPASSSVAYCKK